MNTMLCKTILSLTTCGLLFCSLVSVQAATLYNSGGFETFIPTQNLNGQDPAPPVGNGPWTKDSGTSTAEVTAANPIEGNQSVKITRSSGATGNTRWGVVKSVTPAGLNNVINIYFDMRVLRETNEFGPLFGIEAYDASLGAPKFIGSLLLDVSSGQILCHAANTGAFAGTGTYLDVIVHHHYRLAINFTAKTCSLYADGNLVHTEGFVDSTATQFTDAPLATLALDPSNNNAGTAYFDNYLIEHTTSQLPYLTWQGDGSTNKWSVGGDLNWNDGIASVTFSNGAAVLFDDTGSATPAINLQGSLLPGSVKVSADQDYQFGGTGSINDAAGLVKKGQGTLTIFNSNGYTNDTQVLQGRLSIRNTTGSATGSSKVSVFPQCIISGDGTIGGSLWVASGGVLEPGVAGPGTLTISNQLVLDDATLKFDLGVNSDQLVAGGDLTLGGTLAITNSGGFGPGTYTLITYGGALTVGSLLVTAAPSGYDYTISTNTPGQINLLVALPPLAPATPSGLTAAPISSQQINLAWLDNSTNESSFRIERSVNNTTFAEVASTGANASSYSDTGLASGTTYYYRVRARNAGGDSGYSAVASATTVSSEAIAWYEFENNTLDSSGNNNHAVPTGAFTYGGGKRGLFSAIFDGTTFATLTKIVETNFTVAAWVKTTAAGELPVVDAESPGTSADWGTLILNGKFGMFIGAPNTFVYSSVNVNDGSWHHVAATRRSDTGEVRLYVDGSFNTNAILTTGPRSASIDFHIGANHAPTALKFFTGSMDDVKIFDNTLTPSEVAALSKQTFGQWQLDNFGCTNCPQADANYDADGDGVKNGDEFAAGTSPTNSLSVFKITSMTVQGSNAGLTWSTVGGCTNVVQSVVGDSNGGISPAFIDVSGPIVVGGSGDTSINFVDVGAADGVSRYYRIRQLK
jgi:autotransporter-associated beta strand protein